MPADKSRLISLTLGDPSVYGNLPPPDTLIRGVTSALGAGASNGYEFTAGAPAARTAVAAACTIPAAPLVADDVFMTHGGCGALELTLFAVANAGDNILVPRPGFSYYGSLASAAGMVVRHYSLRPERRWEADLEEMEALCDGRTRAIVVNNPSNPCGSVYTAEHLRAVLAVAARRRVLVIADEVYEKMASRLPLSLQLLQTVAACARRTHARMHRRCMDRAPSSCRWRRSRRPCRSSRSGAPPRRCSCPDGASAGRYCTTVAARSQASEPRCSR
jgi:aspartate/methionine/tyrosine aminotransferase